MFKKLAVLFLALSLSVLAFGRGYSGGGGRSFSSSSSRSSSHSYSSSSSGKSYSSGSKSSPSSPSASKSSPSFFGRAEKAQAKADSKATYEKYKGTQQSYDYLKSQPKETYATRTTRQQTVFKTYYVSQPQPQMVYHDSTWNPYFWMWMLDHRDRQAEWVYNHRSEISDERYKELTAKNKDLEAQVKALEDKKVAKDPNYAPKEIDKDLMYSDDYVKDVQEQADEPKDDASDFNWFLWLLVFPASLALGGWAIYAVFFKKREF